MPKKREEASLLMSSSIGNQKSHLGFYRRNRNAGCKRKTMVGGTIACSLVFGLGGLAVVAYVVFFDGFLLTLWPRIYYAVVGAGVGLTLLGIVGILMLCMPKRLLPRVLFTLAGLGVIAACGIALGIMVEDTRANNLSEVEDTWRGKWEADRRSQTLCDLQETLDCSGWEEPCNSTHSRGSSDDSGDEFLGELCPICTADPKTKKSCLQAIKDGIDRALPILGVTIALVFIVVLINIFWAWRARALKKEEEDAEMEATAPTNHYL